MPNVELTQANFQDLFSLRSYPEIAAEMHGIVAQTLREVSQVNTQQRISEISKNMESALNAVLRKAAIPERESVNYKINSVVLDICIRAIRQLPRK